MKHRLSLIIVGFVMGIAETIPGVSGGTIAFITGIYEELINTIKGINFNLIGVLRKEGISAFWKAINGNFLVLLVGGMVLGIGVGIVAITFFIEHYPEPLWALFFGLIIASSIYIGRQIEDWDIVKVILLVIGLGLSLYITIVSPTTGSTSLYYVFLSGAIAISALLLPGISGSFILLLMGMYFVVMPELKNLATAPNLASLTIVVVFALGCLFGMICFSRILSWTFKNYKNQTLALLTGFIIGSLNKIWPWRIADEIVLKQTQQHLFFPESITVIQTFEKDAYKILSENNVLPQDYNIGDPKVAMVCIALVLGLILVLLLARLDGSSSNGMKA